jgi:Ca-activated chloride channel family protein
MIPLKKSLIVLLLIGFSTLYSQSNYLNVLNPQQQWQNYRGSIEEATISIGPRGLYSQVSLYLTFSAKPNQAQFSTSSQLEVILRFSLPKSSFVTDLWLWLDDKKISRGTILDVWTASQIYESIVNRRQDPAILKKVGDDYYELRVYPMKSSETRKVRITYLVPNFWSDSGVSVPLPLELLKTSYNKIPNIYVKTWTNEEWNKVEGLNFNANFEYASDDFFGEHKTTKLNDYQNITWASVEYNNPMVGGVYFKLFKDENDDAVGYYQLSVLPSKSITVNKKKVLFLVDYNPSKSTNLPKDIIGALKECLKNSFNEADSFNIFFSGLTINKISDTWLSSSRSTIDSNLNKFGESSVSNVTNLPSLLKSGFEFLSQKNDGVLFLLAASDQIGNYENSNSLITDLRKMFVKLPKIFIADFGNKGIQNYYFGGRNYLGNEYFYENMARLSSGQFSRYTNSLPFTINALAVYLSGSVSSFDLFTTFKNGFSFSRQNISESMSDLGVFSAVRQIGKYRGELPFNMTISGVYNFAPFSDVFVYDDEVASQGDSTIKKMWVGNYIREMEKQTITNSTINQIINYSSSARVLSKYTAFLAVEGDTAICYTCTKDDGAIYTDIDDEEIIKEFSMSAYPNPFNPQTEITVKLPVNIQAENLNFTIYNILGQLVKTFDVREFGNQKVLKFRWNGLNDAGERVGSGIYLFNVSGASFSKSLKLVLLK